MSARCNCADWDDESPCGIHGERKLPPSEEVCHQIVVVRVCRRYSNRKWFYTIARDALREFTSQDFDTKKEATPI